MRAAESLNEVDWRRLGRIAFALLFALFVWRDAQLLWLLRSHQPLGLDLLPIWTGVRSDPTRLYDFAYITAQQSWLFAQKIRPFVYPPSALPLLAPLGVMPFWVAYGMFVLGSGTLFVWAGRRLGASWAMLAATPVFIVALAGQVTFLIGGLVMAAVSLKNRPVLAGVLFGIAGAIKPQMLVLLPLALASERNWRAFFVTGATAVALGLISLGSGASWTEWFAALPRFYDLVAADPSLSAGGIAPFAAWGPGTLIVTAPAAAAGVWFAFRTDNMPLRVLALLGGALAVSPYAMNYELAVIVPAVLALEKRPSWSLLFWAAISLPPDGPLALILAVLLLFKTLADGVGFEPTVGFHLRRFSRPLP